MAHAAHQRLEPAGRLLARVAEGAARRPRLVLLVALLVTLLAAGLAATHLRIDTDSQHMLSDDLPHRQREFALDRAFPSLNDRLVILVDAADADSADRFLARLDSEIRARPEALDAPFAPAISPYFLRNGLLYRDDAELDSLLARMTRAGPLLATLAAEPSLSAYFASLAEGVADADRIAGGEEALTRALAETRATIDARLAGSSRPVAFSRLFAEDDAPVRRILTVTPRLDFSELQPARPARKALAAAIAAADPARDGVRVQVTGDTAMRSEELGSVAQGIGFSLAFSLVALSALLWFAFRNLRLSVLALSIVFIANAVAAAFAALTFEALNLVSMAFAVLLTGVGADFAVHFILHARQPGATAGEAMRRLGPALLLCAASTIFGFLAFVPTPFQGMAQLGFIGAVGVMAAFIATLFVIPAGLALVPPAPLPGSDGPGPLGRLPQRPLLILGLALLAGAALLAPQARFETDPMALRDPDSPAVRAFSSLFDEKDTRPYSASVLVANEAEAEALATRLAALPEVDRVVTPWRLLPGEAAVYRRDAIDAVAYGLLPQLDGGEPPVVTANGLQRLRAALAAHPRAGGAELATSLDRLAAAGARDPALFASVERDVLANWPATLDRLRQSLSPDPEPGIDDLPPELLGRYLASDGQVRVEVVPSADLRDAQARAAFIAAVRQVAPEAAGPVFNIEASGRIVERAMLTATFTALLACGLLLLAVERNVWRTLATLAPILAACLLTLGGSVLFQIPFNYANVIALPMLIGAGIDSAIHMAAHPPERGGASVTARAIVITALTTITSFGSLIFSAHQGVSSIGALLLIALASTTFAALVLEPPLLRLVSRFEARGPRRKAPVP